ncbi:SDR family NAD(P)-dependent oxidoreductase [Glaciihabitans sp. dw_435]|uniref:SDR family NAD(P)-dependent oxidoreductase n=1 Tax=Glaciihabitans sp. dw_435 TaxID=2720081 RepID=UPI001BD592B9|nr:SDR family NAD(P)-dependent oxidoreductase [Glaciihabitans sp. dw_435]
MTEPSRTVLIAGASSAAGHACAAALQATGVRVIAVGSDAGRLADVPADASYVCDLSDPAAVLALAETVRTEVGPIDGLVHLVGGWKPGNDDATWAWLEERLITTLRNTTLAFRDDLVASPAGRLAVVSSTSVDSPTWSSANYATAKAAAEAWVGSVASGWAKAGTAAAVTFVVRALGTGENDTSVDTLATRVAGLWDAPVVELNGARIRLTTRSL